jgi:hypothetical protein
MYSKKRTARTGQQKQDSQNRTIEQGIQNKTARIGQPERDTQGRTGQAEQDRQNKTAMTGLPRKDYCHDKAARTGLPGTGLPG